MKERQQQRIHELQLAQKLVPAIHDRGRLLRTVSVVSQETEMATMSRLRTVGSTTFRSEIGVQVEGLAPGCGSA
jgi:hypothetical protein